MKMEQTLMGYKEGERAFYVYQQNWQGKIKSMAKFVNSWNPLQKEKNEKIEAFLKPDANLSSLFRKMFHIWDGKHRLQAWFPYINLVHLNDVDEHVFVDNFVLDII